MTAIQNTETIEDRTCGACKQVFGSGAEVFSHACPALEQLGGLYGEHPLLPGDTIDGDRPTGNGSGSRRHTSSPATEKQVAFMRKLGIPEHLIRGATKVAASEMIDQKLEEQRTANKAQGKPANPASEKQVAFLNRLLDERPSFKEAIPHPENLDKAAASKVIDELLKQPKEPKPREEDIDDGFYYEVASNYDGSIFKVQYAKHGSGNLYAKRLTVDTGRFDYEQGLIGKIRRGVKAGTVEKLTLERAKELGRLYGRCCICGATLTNEESIEEGIGPICRNKI